MGIVRFSLLLRLGLLFFFLLLVGPSCLFSLPLISFSFSFLRLWFNLIWLVVRDWLGLKGSQLNKLARFWLLESESLNIVELVPWQDYLDSSPRNRLLLSLRPIFLLGRQRNGVRDEVILLVQERNLDFQNWSGLDNFMDVNPKSIEGESPVIFQLPDREIDHLVNHRGLGHLNKRPLLVFLNLSIELRHKLKGLWLLLLVH